MALRNNVERKGANRGDKGVCFGLLKEGGDCLDGLIVGDKDSSQVVVGAGKERSKEFDRVREIDCDILASGLFDISTD